jgi:flagellar motor switch protein FliM
MIGQKFEQQWMLRKTDPTEAEQSRMLNLLSNALVRMDARLEGPRLKVGDLLDLEVGDCLKFDYLIEKKLHCLMNGKLKFQGHIIDYHHKRVLTVDDLPADLPGAAGYESVSTLNAKTTE